MQIVDFRKNGEMQMARTMANGIVNELSNYQSTILSKDSSQLQATGGVVFGLVDHSGEVEKSGLEMNNPEYFQKRHGFPEDLLPSISALRTLASGGVREMCIISFDKDQRL